MDLFFIQQQASFARNRAKRSPAVPAIGNDIPARYARGSIPYHASANSAFWQRRWNPEIMCRSLDRVGSFDEPKAICDLERIRRQPECLVYSVGSNNDFTFESALLGLAPHCEIHVFDHTIGEHPSNKPDGIHFHAWGVKGDGGGRGSSGKLKTLREISSLLGHTERQVDIFKMDCEGCEIKTMLSWFHGGPSGKRQPGVLLPKQMIFELHLMVHNAQDWASPQEMDAFLRTLTDDDNFAVLYKEVNLRAAQNGEHCCAELTLVNVDWLAAINVQ